MEHRKKAAHVRVVKFVLTAFIVRYVSFTRMLRHNKKCQIGSLGHSESETQIRAVNIFTALVHA